MALTAYLTQTQRLLSNPSGSIYSPGDLTIYINIARQQIAGEGQCVRVTPPLIGSITAVTAISGGTGFIGAPSVVFHDPTGTGASATATISGGAVTAVAIVSGGSGYTGPTVTFSGGGGSNAAAAVVTNANITVQGQEIYPFSALNLTSFPGVLEVLSVRTIAMIWGTFQYTCQKVSYSKYQAMVRNYTNAYQYIPAVAAQFGQGVSGSLYLYPIPSAPYPMVWDCLCLPTPLASDSDPEAIPYPWTDVVPFHAAYLALLGAYRYADADRLWNEAQKYMRRARAYSQPQLTANWYGRPG